jgi:hypothetical protein
MSLSKSKKLVLLALSLQVAGQGLFLLPAMAQEAGPPDPKPAKDAQKNAEKAKLDSMKSSFMNLFKQKKTEGDDKDENGRKNVNNPQVNPYGTTTPDISDPASDRSVPRPSSGIKPVKAEKPQMKPIAHPPLLNQPPLQNAKVETPVVSEENPPVKLVTLDNPANPLGFADAESKLNQVGILIKQKDISGAKTLLLPLRQWLVDSTEAHLSLHKALSNIPSARAQAELEKQLALQFALLRDKSLFQMGSIEVAEKNFKTAIKDLTEVIKSQPRSEMGLKSYQMLQEIGFTEKLQLAE